MLYHARCPAEGRSGFGYSRNVVVGDFVLYDLKVGYSDVCFFEYFKGEFFVLAVFYRVNIEGVFVVLKDDAQFRKPCVGIMQILRYRKIVIALGCQEQNGIGQF